MSKNNPKKSADKALAEKLSELGLPGDITSIIGRKFQFTINNESIVAGTIIDLLFQSSCLFLLLHRGEIEMLSEGKGRLQGVMGEEKWAGVLRLL